MIKAQSVADTPARQKGYDGLEVRRTGQVGQYLIKAPRPRLDSASLPLPLQRVFQHVEQAFGSQVGPVGLLDGTSVNDRDFANNPHA